MKRLTILAAACAVSLTACGIYGPKGNDTGGVIPWSLDNEAMMHMASLLCRMVRVVEFAPRRQGRYTYTLMNWPSRQESNLHPPRS